MSAPSTPIPAASPLPPRPRLVLRVGFAGRKDLSTDERMRLEPLLQEVLSTLGHRLAAMAPGVPVEAGREPPTSAFYARQCPLLRLVTGLCEGADALAAQVLERVRISPDSATPREQDTRRLETELAAVLPFDVVSYRQSRPVAFQAEFDRQLSRCAWILALDGIYEKPDPDTALAKSRRARAYRAQSSFILRQSDLLVAAANPDEPSRAGGTLETVRAALAFELPVVFIHIGNGSVHLIAPDDDLDSALARPAPAITQWQRSLDDWVTQLTADPDSGLDSGEAQHGPDRKNGEAMLKEFLNDATRPSQDAQRIAARFRKQAWTWFETRFRSGPGASSDPKLKPYDVYRSRATELNYHYAGLYRGAFLLNYALAIVAVALAAVSLVLLATAGHAGPDWLMPALLAFATVKLGILIFISRNTRRANREEWNDRAVNYRYLAERLRGMYYLPRVGSQQPPTAAPPQFASRAVRQSAVDWLFETLVRAISPADLPDAQPRVIPAHNGIGAVQVKKLFCPEPAAVVATVRDAWVGEQARYHDRNARTMHALDHAVEHATVCLGFTVIFIVALDILILFSELLHWLPDAWEPGTKLATPWLICISAVLPAIMAALNGIRFQSECQRLAERSAVMRIMLAGRQTVVRRPEPVSFGSKCCQKIKAHLGTAWHVLCHLCGRPPAPKALEYAGGRWQLADELARRIAVAQCQPASDPGSWSHDALRLTERVATDFVQEAAEWSVLYAKEVSDPG